MLCNSVHLIFWKQTVGRCEDGFTPLLMASDKGHAAVVTLLLDRGANIEAKTKVWRCCSSSSVCSK